MSKDLVVKSNRLNMALQSLSLSEIRIMQIAIIDARETGKGLTTDQPLTISSKRYAEAFNVSRQTAFDAILDAEKNLFERRFSFLDTDEQQVKSRWVQRVKYLEKEASVELILTYDVVKEITRLDGYDQFFTQYLLSQTAGMKSVYSVRLYELLIQWKTAGKTPILHIDTFREQMGVSNKEYKIMSDFKRRVLEVAIKEINDKSDLKVKYEQEKEGTKIIGFKFFISNAKKNKSSLKDINPEKFTNLNGEQANQPSLFAKSASWHKKGLSESQINKLAVHKKDFVDANTGKISPNDRRDYPEIFDDWRILLKNPEQAITFNKVQDILDRPSH